MSESPRRSRHAMCVFSIDYSLRRDEFGAQTLVRVLFVIMLFRRSDGDPEVRFAEEHRSVEALGLGRPDTPYCERVQIWTSGREDLWLRPTVARQAPKGSRVHQSNQSRGHAFDDLARIR